MTFQWGFLGYYNAHIINDMLNQQEWGFGAWKFTGENTRKLERQVRGYTGIHRSQTNQWGCNPWMMYSWIHTMGFIMGRGRWVWPSRLWWNRVIIEIYVTLFIMESNGCKTCDMGLSENRGTKTSQLMECKVNEYWKGKSILGIQETILGDWPLQIRGIQPTLY